VGVPATGSFVAGLLVALALGGQGACAAHEASFYPSFYPQEIRIETVEPAAAVAGWEATRVHAYVGADLFAGGPVASDAVAVTSLHSYLVLTFDAASGRYAAATSNAPMRCAAADKVLRVLAPGNPSYVVHPYPVTPYHADYLEQFDLAQHAQAQYSAPSDAAPSGHDVSIRTMGGLADTLVPAAWKATAGQWDATLEEIDVDGLGDRVAPGPGGWLGPPWTKQGWFQAYLLYAGHVHGAAAAASAEGAYRRLVTGAYSSATERVRLERALVTTLITGCERVVLGYTLQHEYFNAEYSKGVENVGFDSQAGLLAAIFPRTVKLKDFPWNGWLRVGVASGPGAAWNPIGGFDDEFGRLLWFAVGDPALLPAPYGGSWIANRVRISSEATPGSVTVPSDAVRPEAGNGLLRRVGSGSAARQRLRYRAVTSVFHDGTQTEFADLIYPYIFAARWDAKRTDNDSTFDPIVARAAEPMTQWLAGFKLIGVTTESRDFGDDLQFHYRVPVVDVYLNYRSSDPWEAAAAAPPWSTLPWELIVLMEEAVKRGIAAFSESEAKRRGIPWLDLVRDRATGLRLAALVEEFGRHGYRPAALTGLVSIDAARARWNALGAFYAHYGHFLDTNGPYRLESWSPDGVVLQVFRDPSYPQGVGALDAYAIPLRAYASSIQDFGDRLEIRTDVEQVSRFQRSYEIARVSLGSAPADRNDHNQPECRYVIVAPNGEVARAGAASFGRDGRYALPLTALHGPGVYTIMIASYVGGNDVNPEVKLVEHRVVAAAPAPTRHSGPHPTGASR
jgi:hypothetical protein